MANQYAPPVTHVYSPSVRRWRASERAGPNAYYEKTEDMPRIPDIHLQSVVFIYPTEADAKAGEQLGGSGFVVQYPSGVAPWSIRYVVTNQHIVDGGGHWVRLNHPNGTHIVHIPPDQWRPSINGDDFALALLRLPPHVVPFELPLDSHALSREEAAQWRVGPGDEIYMMGRFIAHGGRVTNNPIARFGNLSLMPNPMELVRDGRERDIEAFLIEMRSHAGFSGSPVFLRIPQFSFRGLIGDVSLEDNQERFRLLGIDTGHKIDHLPVVEWDGAEWRKRDDARVVHPTDVAIVCPIWKVTELLEREDLAAERVRLGQELQETRGHEIAVSD